MLEPISKLPIPIEDLNEYSTKIEGLRVVKPEALLILKQGSELNRKDSVKGLKDQIDIMALLFSSQFDFNFYHELLKKYKLEGYYNRLKTIVAGFKDYTYLDLNPREYKIKKKVIMDKMRK